MKSNNAIFLGSVLLLSACGGDAPPAPEAEAPVAEALPAEMDAAALAETAKSVTLVPSPLETQRVLEAAGIQSSLVDFMIERTVPVIWAS